MLDPWIIEEIRKREEQERLRQERRPVLELPIETPQRHDPDGDHKRDEERGVVIINLFDA